MHFDILYKRPPTLKPLQGNINSPSVSVSVLVSYRVPSTTHKVLVMKGHPSPPSLRVILLI